MTDYAEVDFFADLPIQIEPTSYFDYLRDKGPVAWLPHRKVVAVTGLDEALEVYRDPETFSSCNAVTGPIPGLQCPLEGDDISAAIADHRHELPMSQYLVTQDPPRHRELRSLLMRLFTPKRMGENEDFMWRLSDTLIDEFIDRGKCDFKAAYAAPFALHVIADLLGVPEEEHAKFREHFAPPPGTANEQMAHDPLAFIEDIFTEFVEDRRRHPRKDVLTSVANAKLPDGSTPEVADVVRTATFLFAAGQETTATFMTSAMRYLADDSALQGRLRSDPAQIPAFLEEMLRLEAPVKTLFRLVRRTTELGGVKLPAGTTVMVALAGANRDPRRFECPYHVDPNRDNASEHLAFGRGIHSCPGGPLARIEARVSLERLLARLGDIRLDEAVHGPAGERRFDYLPTYILRGLMNLNLEFERS
ncbi:MAG: cytochrome P450 [Myxococcales bacterium]|nr:cytochrome P450 [Myxococcales bacterium]